MAGFIADTMAVILWLEKRKMPHKAKTLFIKAEQKEVDLYVPAMVLAEIGYLAEKKKIEVTLADTIAYLSKHSILIRAIDVDVIKSAFEITDIPELHDRLIAAAGRVHACPIITNDPKIIASKFVSTIWDQ